MMVDGRYLPTPNQRIEITEAADASPGSRRVYFTRVEDVRDEVITVVCPMSEGEVVPLREGMQVTVTYIRHRALLSFDAKVVARVWGDVPRLRLTRPTEVTRVQRRSYLRMPAMFPVMYAPMGDDQGAGQVVPVYRAESIDISAGGLRIRLIDVVVGIRFSSYVRLEFSLPGMDAHFELIAQVMRIEQWNRVTAETLLSSEDVATRRDVVDEIANRRHGYRLALRFVDISQLQQDCIMKFVFNRERELIERGVLNR